MVTFIEVASKESASLQTDIRSTSHLLDLCKIQLFQELVLGMKESREELLLKVPVVCDFSSVGFFLL